MSDDKRPLFNIPDSVLPKALLEGAQNLDQPGYDLNQAKYWIKSVWSTLKFLQDSQKISPEIDFIPDLKGWVQNIDHGLVHSMSVFKGMIHLSKLEQVEVNENILRILAVFHDLGNFLPYADFKTGVPKTGNQYREHPQIMADFFKDFGKDLELSSEKISILKQSILHHDDSFFGIELENSIPIEGKLLADADELFGMGVTENPKLLVQNHIERNLMFAAQKLDGWYFIRPELSSEIRNAFQYGDRWLSDVLSAIRSFKYLSYQTKSAQKISKEIEKVFDIVALQIYGDLFDAYQHLYAKARTQKYDLYKTAKSADGLVKKTLAPLKDLSINLIEELYQKPLDLEPKYLRLPYTDPRGWNLAIDLDGELKRIDPSVIRFETKQAFLEAVKMALD